MSTITSDQRWDLIRAFFDEKGLVRQHLDSYNDFVQHALQKIIDEVGLIDIELGPDRRYQIKLGRWEWGSEPNVMEAEGLEARILPMDSRMRNLTYSIPMYLYMTPIMNGEEQNPIKVYIGRLPVMLKSVLCPLSKMSREELLAIGEDPDDAGGYFIINGAERCVVTQEDLAVNRVLVDHGPSGSSVTHLAKVFSATAGFRAPVTLERTKDGTLHVTHPSIPSKLPLAVLMRGLGLKTDKEIVESITDDPEIQRELLPSLEQAAEIATVDDALDYLGIRVAIGQVREFRIMRAQQILDKYFLPHIGATLESRKKKALFVGQMAEKLLELILGRRETDDKDHYSNKRLKLAGDLLASLFRVAFRSLQRDLKYQIEKVRTRDRPVNLETLVRADIITERLRHALATGNWVGGKAGVSQLLDRTNHVSTLSHLRRVVSPLSRSQPHFEARDLHPTQWGRLCPNETPEGPNCGLVKNLALMSYISVGIDEAEVETLLLELGMIPVEEARANPIKASKVYLNGRLVGVHKTPEKLIADVRHRRARGLLSDEANIGRYKDEYLDEVQINCDAGRVRRPLIIVENGKPKVTPEHIENLKNGWTWGSFIKEGLVEYLDAEEEENALIALEGASIKDDTTHLEIAIPSIFGICASLIPYSQHNQSPRNSYSAAMAKQALGFSTLNILKRLESRGHLLHYPQRSIVTTKGISAIGQDKRPSGQNFIVAVLSYTGYNIEDAIIMNKSAVQRGLGRSTFFRMYEAEEKRYPGGEEDRVEIPDPSVRGYRTSEAYRHLEEDGIASLESRVEGGDVIIGRTSPPRFAGEYRELGVGAQTRRETSISLRHGERGTVDTIVVTETVDRNKLVKIRVRDERIPELGDKFASRHGQKGVIGILLSQEDMPFTESGIVPDLIVNPHGIPARMTVGQLLEMVAGKSAALAGREVDGTPFTGEKEQDIRDTLKKLGFRDNGTEIMYDGRTGEIMKGTVFIGCIYYQKLHHMVADKMHARARGPVQILTRQPTEGRAREGGLRFGEMERDALIGHGAAMLLKERLLDESDRTNILICETCGFLAYHDMKRDRYVCYIDEEKAKISTVTVSYAFKLLLQEMMSLGLAPQLQLGAST